MSGLIHNSLPRVDVLIATLLYLLSRLERSADDKLMVAIADHLSMLTDHPDCESDLIKRTADRLQMYWIGKLEGSKPDQSEVDSKTTIKNTSLH